MAWEWAPPLATVVVGVAGVTGTWLAGRNQGQIALESARLGGESSRILAGEERHQRRIETSYQNLDRNLSVVHKLIGRLVSTKTSGPEVTIKEMPPDFLAPSVFDPLDLDRLYRSPLVQQLMEQFDTEVALLRGHVTTITLIGAGALDDSGATQALQSDVTGRAQRILQLIENVRAQMSLELRGEQR
jgi:hypothetical protein